MKSNLSVDEIKRTLVDPKAVCAVLGLRAWPTGQSVQIRCPSPHHEDRNPSCSVFVGRYQVLRFRCHGCGFGGDVLDLIGHAVGIDPKKHFKQLLRYATKLSVAAPGPTAASYQTQTFPSASFELLLGASPFDEDITATRYLGKRKVLDPAVHYGLGVLPAGSAAREELVSAIESSVVEDGFRAAVRTLLPHHRLLIPYRDGSGAITAVQGRVIGNAAGPRYMSALGSRFDHPFGMAKACEEDDGLRDLVFCEGALDTLACRASCEATGNYRTVLGLPSATKWSPQWAALATNRRVILALDDDDAGRKATVRIVDDLYRAGVCQVLLFEPNNGDINASWVAI